jgi:arylsulfatase A-like enzyme
VSRALPAFPGVVERSYEFVDQLLGELIDASPADTTFVVVSERGHDDAGESEDEAAPAPGVLVIRGPHVVAQPAAELDPSAFDVAPTLLALFGLPPQKDWPGRPLHEVFAPESAAGRASEPIESYGAYRPSWPELAEITELQSQREALRWLRELDALGP